MAVEAGDERWFWHVLALALGKTIDMLVNGSKTMAEMERAMEGELSEVDKATIRALSDGWFAGQWVARELGEANDAPVDPLLVFEHLQCCLLLCKLGCHRHRCVELGNRRPNRAIMGEQL